MRMEIATRILLVVLMTAPSSSYYRCVSWSVLQIRQQCNGCGICLWDTQVRDNRCAWDRQNYFFEKERCQPINYCYSNVNKAKCGPFKCLPMFGSFRCRCDKNTFGRFCEFSKPQGVPNGHYADVADIILTPLMTFDEYATISIFFNNLGKNGIAKITTDHENITYSSKGCEKIVLNDYCLKWYRSFPQLCRNNPNLSGKIQCVMTFNLYFPFVETKAELIDYSYHAPLKPSNVKALKEFFAVSVYNDLKTASHNPVFRDIYNIIVGLQAPHLFACGPRIYFRNVGVEMTRGYMFTYALRDEIIVHSYIEYQDTVIKPVCVGTGSYMYSWKVWRMVDNVNIAFQKPLIEVNKDTKLYLKPFSLKIGTYKLILNVTCWTRSIQSFAFLAGYFEIVELDLEAVISGGEEREIYYNENFLKLDGSQSWDPNIRPSKQPGSLKFYWRCNRTDTAFCQETRSDNNMIYTGPFLKNEYYKFYLTVKSAGKESKQDTTSQIIFMSPIKLFSVKLICRKNCGWGHFKSNPGVVIYFEAVVLEVPSSSNSSYNHFNWSYSPGSDGNYLPLENIRQNNTPNNILIVLKNTLTAGQNYTFRAKGVNENVGQARFLVKMAKKLSNVSCKLDSKFKNITIIRGVTPFKVECDSLKYNKFAPVYDFYDIYNNENISNGRLIVSTRSKIELLVLIRGNLIVELTDEYGMTSLSQVNVTLKDNNKTREFIFDSLNSLRQHHLGTTSDNLDATFLINTISVIYDLLASEKFNNPDITDIAEYMLRVCADIEIDNTSILKMLSSLLNTVASGGLKTNLSMNSINYLSRSVTKLSGKLLFEIQERFNLTDISELNIIEIYKLCHQLLKICDSIYESSAIDLSKKMVNKVDTQDYYSSYRESSGSLMRSVRDIMSCLSLISLPYEWPTTVKEDHINIWIKEDTPEAFSESGYEAVPSVEVSNELAESAGKVTKFVAIFVAQFDDNPYRYNLEYNIYTNAVDLRILFKPGGNVLRTIEVSNPVVVNLRHMGTEKTVINGSVCQPDPEKSLDIADMQVAVHQIRVPEKGRLAMKFLGLEDGQMIRVRVLLNKRPDYKYMVQKDAYNITQSNPYYRIDLEAPHSQDLYDLHYIGILPGPNHPINSTIIYSFEMSTFHCVSWKFHEWSTRDCEIKEATESFELKCSCEIFSTIAGFSQIPLNKFDPFKDLQLLLTETNNPFVQMLLCLLFLSFLLLLILAFWKDNSNVKGKVIYLEDNFPGDKFSYLIAVFTGSKFFGGTTSKVGIMIEGDKCCSRPHILRSSWCRTLEKGEDDWFLLSTMSHLGNLKMIHLWMDYSGKRPEWYCYKIIIIDMLSHDQYLFLVDAWLSLRGKNFIERFVKVSKSDYDKRVYMAVDNLIFGLRDTHLWLGVCYGHPRSIVSRTQRVATAFNQLLIIMLISCLFLTVIEQRDEDYPYYHLSSYVVLIMVVSIIVSSILINILMSVFRKTFLFKDYGKKGNNQNDESSAIGQHMHKSTNFVFRCFEDSLTVLTSRKKFKPVILKFDKKGISRKEKKYSFCCLKIGWMVTVALIVICFILIYIFSTSMRKVKTLVWLTCVVLSLLLILFLIAPLKIFGLALLSGLFYYNINQVVSYHIRMHLLEKYKKGLIDSQRKLVSKLISMRRNSCYVPLAYDKIVKKFHKQRKFDATLLLLDMFLIGVLLVLLFIQNESLWTTKYYWNNKQLRSLLRQGYMEEGAQLYSLTNLSRYSLFLEKNLFPVIYRTRWYNKQPILDGNSTVQDRYVFGGTSQLFGLPRLRQIRLRPGLCEKPIYDNLSQYCNVKLTKDTEDTNLYAEGWVETGPREKFLKLSPWNYMNNSETYDTTLFGYSNIAYEGAGYVAELDKSEEKAEDIVLSLHREKWLDRHTSVVIFMLTLYNAFSGTFSWLISVTENLHIGLLMNRVYVFTVSDNYDYPIVDLLFFASLFMFTVRVFFVVNRNGIDDFADDFWNFFEMIMVCLGIVCAVLYILNINSKFNYFKIYMIGGTREKYFEFFHLLQYLDLFRIILSILAFMLVCRFMKSWRFGKTLYMFFITMSVSWGTIIVIFLIVVLASYLYWAYLSYMINDFMILKLNFPIMSQIDFKHIAKSCNTTSCKIGPFIFCFISLIVELFTILIFLVSFRIVKRKNIEILPMNFFTVYFERVKQYLFEFKNRNKKRI